MHDPQQIIKLNELYYKYKNYAKVGREVGMTGPTVKKHIIPNYIPVEELLTHRVTREDVPEVDLSQFEGLENWGDLCVLSDKEKQDMIELWKELPV